MRRKAIGGMLGLMVSLMLGATPGVAQEGPAAPQPASPQAPAALPLADSLTGEAKAEYESGRMLYEARDFAGALLKFQRAYELSQDGRLLWNMAVCEKNQRRYVRVLELVTRYQREADALVSEHDKAEADALATAVKAFVSPVAIQVDQAQAEVMIDEVRVGESPLAGPVLVDMGPRRLKVTKVGYKDHNQLFNVPGNVSVSLSVVLEPEKHEGKLMVKAEPGQIIWIDGQPMGNGRWEGVLPSGGHSLRVSGPDRRTYQAEVIIQDNRTRTMSVMLEPAGAPAPAPIAESGNKTWMWVLGGAALSAGLIAGGYFLFRPEDESAPGPSVGTMPPGTIQLPLFR